MKKITKVVKFFRKEVKEMWVSPNFNKVIGFKRKGICKEVIYDVKGDYETRINKESKQLLIGKYSNNLVITEEYGVRESVECVGFLIDGGLCLSIEKGTLYFKSRHNEIFSISSDGFFDLERKREIEWVNREKFYEYIKKLIEIRFELNDIRDIEKYINNLIFRFEMGNKSDEENNKLVNFKILKYYTPLCFDELKIEELEQEENELVTKISLNDFEELMRD